MNSSLTHKIAALKARVVFLESVSDTFVELSDMTMFRKVRSDIEEFIKLKQQLGELPNDPYAVALNEIDHIEIAIKKVLEIYHRLIELGKAFSDPRNFPIDILDFNALVSEYEIEKTELPAKLSEANRLFSRESWHINGDITPSLVEFAQLSCPKAQLHAVDREDIHLFSLQTGSIWQKCKDSIARTEKRINALIAGYESDKAFWGQAEELAATGDYKSAIHILAFSAKNDIVDEAYTYVDNYIKSWEQAALSHAINMEFTNSLTNISTPLSFNIFTFFQERAKRLRVINNANINTHNLILEVEKYNTSQFKQECEQGLNRRLEVIIGFKNLIFSKTWTISFAITAILFALLLLISILDLIQKIEMAESARVALKMSQ